MTDTVSELNRLAGLIERWANIARGNITPEERDLFFDEEILEPDWTPRYIGRDEYYARLNDAALLRSRAKEIQDVQG